MSFEQTTMHIERGDMLDILAHPNQGKYPNQQLLGTAQFCVSQIIYDMKEKNYKHLLDLFLQEVKKLNDLRIPPGNQFEALKGDRKGQHSIRINDR